MQHYILYWTKTFNNFNNFPLPRAHQPAPSLFCPKARKSMKNTQKHEDDPPAASETAAVERAQWGPVLRARHGLPADGFRFNLLDSIGHESDYLS